MTIPITQDFIPVGRRNRPGFSNPMNFITIHNTGNSNRGANARAHASYVRGDTAAGLPVSWHYTVDEDGAFQHLPDNETGWHAGDGNGPGNRQSIGIEICQNSDGNLLKATENAVILTAILCQRHNIAISNIRQHNHWSAKGCPQELRAGRPFTWAIFLAKVTEVLEVLQKPSTPPVQPTVPPTDKTPEEITVEAAFELGILGDKQHWVEVLRGTRTAVPEYVKRIMDNAIAEIRKRTQ